MTHGASLVNANLRKPLKHISTLFPDEISQTLLILPQKSRARFRHKLDSFPGIKANKNIHQGHLQKPEAKELFSKFFAYLYQNNQHYSGRLLCTTKS
jgi:hypothetical protein